MVEADVSIRPLNMVLAYGSAAVSSSGKEKALVVVREMSPEESNSLR